MFTSHAQERLCDLPGDRWQACANAYRIGPAHFVVVRLRKAHKQYADWLRTADKPEGSLVVIYANALLEYPNEPDPIPDSAGTALAPDGLLALGLHVRSPSPANIMHEADINFWKPCHRAIYSFEGMKELLPRP